MVVSSETPIGREHKSLSMGVFVSVHGLFVHKRSKSVDFLLEKREFMQPDSEYTWSNKKGQASLSTRMRKSLSR